MAVTRDAVLIADYKTDRAAAKRLADVPKGYVGQLALYRAVLGRIYPEKTIRAALIFTEGPTVIEVPGAAMEAALAEIASKVTAGEALLTPGDSIHTFFALPILPPEQRGSSMVDKTTDATFDQDVLKATGPVVVDFWAEWCGPCRMIAPALEEISKSLNGKVKIVKLNVDENPGTAAKFGIMSIPTLMLFKDGQLASRQVGAAPKQKLEQWITGAV